MWWLTRFVRLWQVTVVRKLADLMGDSDTSNISVNSINKGSVIFAWTNVSISQQRNPPPEAINYVVHKMFYNNESMSQNLVDAMKPEFNVIRAQALPLVSATCSDEDDTFFKI